MVNAHFVRCMCQKQLLLSQKKKKNVCSGTLTPKSARSLNSVFAAVIIIYHILRLHRCTFLTYQVQDMDTSFWLRNLINPKC